MEMPEYVVFVGELALVEPARLMVDGEGSMRSEGKRERWGDKKGSAWTKRVAERGAQCGGREGRERRR